jgi:hypothetical protein
MTREHEVEYPVVTLSGRGSGYESRILGPEKQMVLIGSIKDLYRERVILESENGNLDQKKRRQLASVINEQKPDGRTIDFSKPWFGKKTCETIFPNR